MNENIKGCIKNILDILDNEEISKNEMKNYIVGNLTIITIELSIENAYDNTSNVIND